MTAARRLLICANPDLNYIDGSSIWSQTLVRLAVHGGETAVDFIAKSPPMRDELLGPLRKNPHINIIDGINATGSKNPLARRLSGEGMADLAAKLHARHDYDVVVVRGLAIARALLAYPGVLSKSWIYLTDIPQRVEDCDEDLRAALWNVSTQCERILCQTVRIHGLWKSLLPAIPSNKLVLYPPVIEDIEDDLPPISQRPRRAVYAGKFKAEWNTLEMAETWPNIKASQPDAELIMIGDKIHSEPESPNFKRRMRRALKGAPGLHWLGAMSRESVQAQLKQARVGLSWRASSMDDSLEYSTKILEYGSCGCAAILNRNELHEELVGKDYPLFANTRDEYEVALKKALKDERIAGRAAAKLMEVARSHTFSARAKEVNDWMDRVPSGAPRETQKRKLRVLVAGHDMKFFKPLSHELKAGGDFKFLFDTWQGHDDHDPARSSALLEQADVIFCEWCLGNVKWYARNKRPDQRLLVRFHAQELQTRYLDKTDWQAIDTLVFVAPHIQRQFQTKYPEFPNAIQTVIPNFVDTQKFRAEKKQGDASFALGLVGYVPKLKRLHRAVDLLEKLLENDSRFHLRVKGRHPLEYSWMKSRKEEHRYYKHLFYRINSNPKLRNKVIFDPPGDDVNKWFRLVGHVLSPSDQESFHLSLAEGILTGCNPVVWIRNGAEELWPKEVICSDINEAAERVLRSDCEVSKYRSYVKRRYGNAVISAWKTRLISPEMSCESK